MISIYKHGFILLYIYIVHIVGTYIQSDIYYVDTIYTYRKREKEVAWYTNMHT